MTCDYLITISEKTSVDLIGSKAKNLQLLSKFGFNIPQSYCLTTQAYRNFIDSNRFSHIIHEILQDDQDAEHKSQQIINLILSKDIPPKILTKLAESSWLTVPNQLWAVRSSSNQEDLLEASFAGLYDSYLSLSGLDNIVSAIKKCWASLWNERAIVYRDKNKINHMQANMAVLFQSMVPAQYAGVIFTKDPSFVNQGQIILEYCEGVGDHLVSGTISPYSCTIDRSNQEICYLQQGEEGRKLKDKDIRELAILALRIEKKFTCPQDIEWAYDGEKIYFLQTRAILPQKKNQPKLLDTLWTRANIGEVLPNVITPLTWDIFRATLYNNPELLLAIPADTSDNDVGVKRIHGRGYIQIKHFLDSFCYLPFVSSNTMTSVLGVNLPSEVQSYQRPTGIPVKLAQLVFLADALGIFPRLSWLKKHLPELSFKETDSFQKIIVWNAHCFQLHIKSTAYAIGAFGLISHLLDRWLPSEKDDLLPQILTAGENMQTADQGRSLWQLAEYVRTSSLLNDVLTYEHDWTRVYQRLSEVKEGHHFLTMFNEFLDANGARAVGEFELAVPRWRENPSFVLSILRKFLQVQSVTNEPTYIDPELQRQQRNKIVSHIKKRLHMNQRLLFVRLLKSYRNFSSLRENIKYQLMEGYALIRIILLKTSNDLVNKGLLKKKNDIFFLTYAEIENLVNSHEQVEQLRELIKRRKAQHATWSSVKAPQFVMGDGMEFILQSAGELIGTGCSPGVAKGVARVIYDIAEAKTLKPGEILITPHTDPGWTPLFLSCKAVVTEIGGFLSHGATVAREYGIPAVVNLSEATSKIKTGDLIQVNGTSGQVIICTTLTQ